MYAFYVAVGSTSLLVSLLLIYQLWIERLMVRTHSIVRRGPFLYHRTVRFYYTEFSTRTLMVFLVNVEDFIVVDRRAAAVEVLSHSFQFSKF
jgi:hypothetical protein